MYCCLLPVFLQHPAIAFSCLASGIDSAEKQPWYMMLDAVLSFLEKSPQVGNFIVVNTASFPWL